MTLRQQQSLFAVTLCQHVLWLFDEGWEVTFGQVHRPPALALIYAEQGIGIADSLHNDKLAADLNLFRHGRYLSSTESHRESGEMWESRHPLCRWGGRFSDGNHYSMTRGGRM